MATAPLRLPRALARHATGAARLVAFDRQRSARGRVHRVTSAPDSRHLAERLDAFERRIVLALTDDQIYHRLHAPRHNDYYLTIGRPAVTLVLVEDDRVIGTQSLVVKRLHVPRRPPTRFVYALNTRICPEARFGAALARLQLAGLLWAIPRCWQLLTLIPELVATSPRSRTGRYGVPAIHPIASCERVAIPLSIACPDAEADRCLTSRHHVLDLRKRLNRERVYPLASRPEDRSFNDPVWLALPDGSACGCLEDFRRVRRFAGVDGAPEIVWPGLTHLAATSTDALERLCAVAAAHAARAYEAPLVVMTDRERGGELHRRFGVTHTRIPLIFHASRLRPLPDAPWEFDVTEI